MYADERLRGIFGKVKPDVIVIDQMCHIPALMDQVPWLLSPAVGPITISQENVPPAFIGFPVDGDRTLWKKYDAQVQVLLEEIFDEFKSWVVGKGGPHDLSCNYPYFTKFSPYANMYMYPEEIDYTDVRPNPPKWHRFDSFVRHDEITFELPEEIAGGQGKLVYFSMGTIGCVNVGMMLHLLDILKDSPNRFIVSKGPRGDEMTLYENMWGAKYVPQTNVIPLVDLVITHGGINTFTEAFYFGKRMIALPLMMEQLDNAQRLVDKGLGLRFHPNFVTRDELLNGIQTLLDNENLEIRMKEISKRIQTSNSQSKAADLIESVARRDAGLI